MIFHTGQRVVCVDASLPPNPEHRAHPLIRGKLYCIHHVSHVAMKPCFDIDGSGRLWEHFRFRIPPERRTDISIFTRMLDPSGRARVLA